MNLPHSVVHEVYAFAEGEAGETWQRVFIHSVIRRPENLQINVHLLCPKALLMAWWTIATTQTVLVYQSSALQLWLWKNSFDAA